MIGNFYLPSIDWSTYTPKQQASSALCDCLINIANDNGFEQLVDKPTIGGNILDIIFTTNPTLINNANTMPSLSTSANHNTIYIGMNVKHPEQESAPT